jgi:tripartite ATP-independent transporter DctP family solute receptor
MTAWTRRQFLTTSAAGAAAFADVRCRTAGAQGKVVLRLANGLTPGHARSRACELFAKRVGELTKGEVTIRVYHEGVLGSEGQVAEALQTGTLDMGAIVLFTNAVTLGQVLDTPYIFRDTDHWKRAVDGKPGSLIAETAPAVGLRLLGYWLGGWRDVYGSKPINGLADLKGLKIRTLQTRVYVELFKAFGAIPTPIAWPEVYLALLQKTVDAAETALTSMHDAKQYEVSKHAALTHHALSTVALLMSEQRWKNLPESARQAMLQAERDSREYQRVEYLKEEAETVRQLKEKGVAFTSPDPAPFREIARTQVHPLVLTEASHKALAEEIAKL